MILLQLGRCRICEAWERRERTMRKSTAWSGSGAGLGGRKGQRRNRERKERSNIKYVECGMGERKMRKSTAWRHGVKKAQSVKTLVREASNGSA